MSRKTFHTEFQSFILFFNIFGLARYSENYYIRGFLCIYSVVNVSIVFSMLISTVFVDLTFYFNTVSVIVSYVFVLSVTSTHFVCTFQTLLDKQCSLLRSLAEIDELFQQKLKHNFDYAKEKRSISFKILVIFMILVLINAMSIYHLYITSTLKYFWYPSYYSFGYIWMRSLQVSFYLILLNNRLNIIDRKLNEFTNSGDFLSKKWPVTSDSIQNKSHAIFIFHNSFRKALKYDQLMNLKRIYGKLFEISDLIDDSFGWSLLAIFTHSFIGITTYGYWLFLAINEINYDMLITSICFMFPVAIVTTVITYWCSSCFKSVIFFGSIK